MLEDNGERECTVQPSNLTCSTLLDHLVLIIPILGRGYGFEGGVRMGGGGRLENLRRT